jgi:hypothetical protein
MYSYHVGRGRLTKALLPRFCPKGHEVTELKFQIINYYILTITRVSSGLASVSIP